MSPASVTFYLGVLVKDPVNLDPDLLAVKLV